MSSLGSGKRPQNPDGGGKSAFTELPSRLRGGGEALEATLPHPPIPNGPAPQRRGCRTSAALQVPAQQLGREPSGRRLQPRARLPPTTSRRSPRGADSAHTARRTRSRVPLRPLPPARGGCGLTAAVALAGSRARPPASSAHGGHKRTKALPGNRANRPLGF